MRGVTHYGNKRLRWEMGMKEIVISMTEITLKVCEGQPTSGACSPKVQGPGRRVQWVH